MTEQPHVLVVDDEGGVRDLMVAVLEREGYSTSQAANGKQALNFLQRGSTANLIICDYRMPEMDGLHLRLALRSDPRFSSIPFILMSGTFEVDEIIFALRQGVRDFLKKPIRLEELLQRVKEALAA